MSIQRLPVGIGLLLEYTAPILVALWARFGQHEQVRSRVWWALALSMLGLGMVAEVWGGSDLDGIGVAAGFAAAGSLAYYFILGEKKVRGDRDPVSLVCWGLGFAGLFWSLLLPWWTFPWALLGSDVSLLGTYADVYVPLWTLCVYLIALGTIVPFVLIIGSLQHLRATQVGRPRHARTGARHDGRLVVARRGPRPQPGGRRDHRARRRRAGPDRPIAGARSPCPCFSRGFLHLHSYASPTASSTVSVLPGGASGHTQAGSYAQDGL